MGTDVYLGWNIDGQVCPVCAPRLIVIAHCPLQVKYIKNPLRNWPVRLGNDPLPMTVKTLGLLTLLLSLLLLSKKERRVFIGETW